MSYMCQKCQTIRGHRLRFREKAYCGMLWVENQTSAHAQAQHCCTDLAKLPKHPQKLREKFYHLQIWANNTQHVATRRNRVAKRSQHSNATCRNIFGRNMLRAFGHPVAMCCNMLGVVGFKDAQKQLARTSLINLWCELYMLKERFPRSRFINERICLKML